MVAFDVVVLHELAHDGAQVPLAERDNVPEALVLNRANEPLGVGVEVRAVGRQAQQVYARGLQQGPEMRRIEGVAVDDDVSEARQRAGCGVGEVAGGLRHPSPVGRAGDAGDVNTSGLEVDDEQHEVAHEPSACEHLHAEEVRRGDGTPVRLEKGLPRHRPSPERSGLDAVLGEDALDGRPSEVEAEVLERAAKPRVAPRRILARHRQQLLDLVASGGWAARPGAGTTPVVLPSDLLAVPSEDGLRRRERCHLSQKLSAEGLSVQGEQPSLGIGEAKALGPDPGPEHAVLGAQVLDRFALSATDPAGYQQNKELKRSGGYHGRRTIAQPDRAQTHGRKSGAVDFWNTTVWTMRIRRVLGYARVSSELQGQGSSLRDQQDMIAAYAKARRLPVPRFYVEAESAVHERNERRDQIQALMADVREGDLVVCDKIDRWSRDPEFTYRSTREILEAGASFYAVGDQCDPSTPDGDSMLGFQVMFAREERKRIKVRMVGTRKILRDQGYYVEGLPPFGYRRSKPKGHKGVEKNMLVIEPAEAERVRRAFALARREALSSIATTIGLARHHQQRVLRSRVYLGEIQNSRGEWIKAKHPAIVDADVFARTQAALDGRKNGGASEISQTSTWILRDVARCAKCGARMASAFAGPHGDGRRYYYRSSHRCTPKHIPVRVLEEEAEPLIVERLEQLREELGREPKRPRTPRAAPDFAQRRAKLQQRRTRYIEAYADESMTREDLRAAIAKLDALALQVDAEEHAVSRPSPLATPEARRSALREVGVIRKAWGKATPEARRRSWGTSSSQRCSSRASPPSSCGGAPKSFQVPNGRRVFPAAIASQMRLAVRSSSLVGRPLALMGCRPLGLCRQPGARSLTSPRGNE